MRWKQANYICSNKGFRGSRQNVKIKEEQMCHRTTIWWLSNWNYTRCSKCFSRLSFQDSNQDSNQCWGNSKLNIGKIDQTLTTLQFYWRIIVEQHTEWSLSFIYPMFVDIEKAITSVDQSTLRTFHRHLWNPKEKHFPQPDVLQQLKDKSASQWGTHQAMSSTLVSCVLPQGCLLFPLLFPAAGYSLDYN